jgi:hypothetical protein
MKSSTIVSQVAVAMAAVSCGGSVVVDPGGAAGAGGAASSAVSSVAQGTSSSGDAPTTSSASTGPGTTFSPSYYCTCVAGLYAGCDVCLIYNCDTAYKTCAADPGCSDIVGCLYECNGDADCWYGCMFGPPGNDAARELLFAWLDCACPSCDGGCGHPAVTCGR